MLEDAFHFKGYEILTNSTINAAKGVLIALRIAKIIEVDLILIKLACLDSVIKQVIFESNVFNCENKEIITAYEERNTIAVPILAEIVAIRDRRKATGNLADEEQRENELITNLNKTNETLPTVDQLHIFNRNHVGLILTEIQNGIIT